MKHCQKAARGRRGLFHLLALREIGIDLRQESGVRTEAEASGELACFPACLLPRGGTSPCEKDSHISYQARKCPTGPFPNNSSFCQVNKQNNRKD